MAYRRDAGDGISVLLITSRDTGRWVIPRGNPIAGLSPEETAAREAFEEAGIDGEIAARPLGAYAYDKKKAKGVVPALVTVFPMEVTAEHDEWPERHERERRWFAPEDAAAAVDEPGLAALFTKVQQFR